jgi:hypothetical protein
MTTSNEKLALAIRLIKQGNKQEGAKILANLLTLEPGLELAWLWLADCSESRERKINCLQMAIKINPNRTGTQKALIDLMCVSQPAPSIAPQQPIKTTPISLNVLGSPVSFSNNEPPIKKQKGGGSLSKSSTLPKNPEEKYVAPDLASQNIKKIVSDKKKGKELKREAEVASTQDAQGSRAEKYQQAIQIEKREESKEKKSKKKKVKESSERPIPYVPPKRISVKTGDNLYADVYWQYHKYPNTDGGMYGNTMYIEDVRISAFSMPRCLKIGKILDFESCDLCTFFAPRECIIRSDPELLDELRIFITSRRMRIVDYRKRRNAKIRALLIELKAHGRPLHYSVLTQIVNKRHPKLGFTEGAVLRTMSKHPEVFENVDKGVYQNKKSKR